MKKKFMYLVRKNHINEEPVQITAFRNDEDGAIDHYYDPVEECFFEPDKFVELFDTKKEAESFQFTFKKLLISKMTEVKDYLIMMDNFVDDDKSSEFYHTKEDYSSNYIGGSAVYWRDHYFDEQKMTFKYKQLAVKSAISLHDQSILYSEVESVYREDKKIILRLKGLCGEVSVTDKIDKEFVSEIFGLQY